MVIRHLLREMDSAASCARQLYKAYWIFISSNHPGSAQRKEATSMYCVCVWDEKVEEREGENEMERGKEGERGRRGEWVKGGMV